MFPMDRWLDFNGGMNQKQRKKTQVVLFVNMNKTRRKMDKVSVALEVYTFVYSHKNSVKTLNTVLYDN